MADLNALYTALKNADAAGDTEAATKLAAHIRGLQNPLPPLAAVPTDGMSTFGKFAAGAGQAVANAGRGLGQIVGMVSDEDIADARKRDAALENTAAGKIGNIAGNVAMFAPTAMIPGANTVTGAATIGALTGGLTTPGTTTERMTAALLQGAGGAAGQALPKVVGSMRAAAEPLTDAGRSKIIGRVMNKAVGDDTAAVVAKLRSAQPLVPGSMPTSAEVAESGGMAALQRAMSSADPEAYANRGMSQASARVSALRDIAKDAPTMQAAQAARDAATKGLYAQADHAAVPATAELKALLNRMPGGQHNGVIQGAMELAKIKGEPLKLGKDIPASFAAATDASGAPILQDVPGEVAQYSGKALHYIKLALDDALSGTGESSMGRVTKGALTGLKNDYLGHLDTAIPAYGQARTAFAEASKPINQMDIGQELVNKLEPALSDYGALAKETAAKYATALRNADATAASATGFPGSKMADVMTPQQMGTLNSVAQDLARKVNAQDLGRGPGSNTFQNFAMDNLAQTMGVPSAVKSLAGVIPGLSPTATLLMKGAQGVGGLAYKNADEAIRRDMAQALLNPQAAARLMESASQPALMARMLRSLPQGVQKALPPEDLLKLIQASPGLAGMTLARPALADSSQ
jgi:hypothetical protein